MKILNYLAIFALGFLSCALLILIFNGGKEIPLAFGMGNSSNANAPADYVTLDKIHVYDNAIVIDVDNASISSYAASGSMKPTFDENSNGIRIVPINENQIKLGDIVTYQSGDSLIVHRVVEIGKDENGTYFVTKGDNNNVNDGKIRFSDIRYITIGVLY